MNNKLNKLNFNQILIFLSAAKVDVSIKRTQISHEEFNLINNEVGKNSKLKERARMMESQIFL